MTATWPPELPGPLLEGYALDPVEACVRTDLEAGPARVRRRTRARADQVQVRWLFTAEQFEAFRVWHESLAWNRMAPGQDLSAWSKVRTTVTRVSGAAPDGTPADKVIETATTGEHFCSRWSPVGFAAGEVVTLSVWAKAAERTRCWLELAAGGAFPSAVVATANLGARTITAANGAPAVALSARADGWYRLALTTTAGAAGGAVPLLLLESPTGLANYTGDGVSGLYFWGVQLRPGADQGLYLPSADGVSTVGADHGAAWFGIDLPRGGAGWERVEARFVGRYRAEARAGANWVVSATLELR